MYLCVSLVLEYDVKLLLVVLEYDIKLLPCLKRLGVRHPLNEVFQTGPETSGCSETDERHICLPVVFEIELIEKLVFVTFSLTSIVEDTIVE